MKIISSVEFSLITAAVVFLIFGNSKLIFAQENSVKTALELSKGTKIKYIKPGKKARIWYKGQKYKVYIDSIGPENIFTKENIFEINKIDQIAIKYKATIIAGSVIGTTGLIFTGLGTYLIVEGYQNNSLGGVIVIVIGSLIDMAAVSVTAIGSGILFIGKKYKKHKDWKFKAVQLE